MVKDKMEKQTIIDELNLAALEGNNQLKPAVINDNAILHDAGKYNINLDDLENFAVEPQQPEALNTTDDLKAGQSKQRYFWQDMDVNLAEVVKKVLASSERAVFMVSDDKIAYINRAAMEMLELDSFKLILGQPFLTYVDKADWNILAENIGEMLTEGKNQKITLRSPTGKINQIDFTAIYLPDPQQFSFILIGAHPQKAEVPQAFSSLYDELTGLPNFFLFEDRVQTAVNNESYKDIRMPKGMIGVAAVCIENLENLRKLHLENFALKKLANTLVLSLRKNATIARGLKYNFWILMPDIANEQILNMEIEKLQSVFKDGISDNFTTHELVVSIGMSVFPNPAHSAKRLIEQAISAVKKAQKNPNGEIVMYDGV